ncbi:MAG: 2-(1,2-epoxy-1,2-dihydrophenyl)acetyl-CoA isomerase PaaG [Janthinobacterium lividum]
MDELLVARRDGVHVLTLNRPDRLNAFTFALQAALMSALVAAEDDPDCRAVLLHGAGRGFCAGQDLTMVEPGVDLGDTLERSFNPLVRRLRSLPLPVVCAVHGVAAGAGANLALACDIVLAGESARFIQSFVKIGLVPDAGGTWTLPRLAGDARARGMAMLGEPVTAAQAAAWGLIWRTLPDDDLLSEAERLAAHLATQPTQAIALMKQALNASAGNGWDAQLDLERDLQRQAGGTPDFREGVAAFLEKRSAVFTGRPG